MGDAAARVLELFLQPTKQGVTGVTHVTGHSVTPKSRAVTTVTPVTYVKPSVEHGGSRDARSWRFNAPGQDAGAPRAWTEALARLDPTTPPSDVPLHRWRRFIEDCGRFLDQGWASCAEALGWGAFDLFGCDCELPFARIDHAGLLWLLNGRKLVALTANAAAVETLTGGRHTYRRSPVESGRVVLAWELSQ